MKKSNAGKVTAMHPEDMIFEVKTFVNQLSVVQEERYLKLAESLGLNKHGREMLFDYVYNCDEPVCFEEYLASLSQTYEELLERPPRTKKGRESETAT